MDLIIYFNEVGLHLFPSKIPDRLTLILLIQNGIDYLGLYLSKNNIQVIVKHSKSVFKPNEQDVEHEQAFCS